MALPSDGKVAAANARKPRSGCVVKRGAATRRAVGVKRSACAAASTSAAPRDSAHRRASARSTSAGVAVGSDRIASSARSASSCLAGRARTSNTMPSPQPCLVPPSSAAARAVKRSASAGNAKAKRAAACTPKPRGCVVPETTRGPPFALALRPTLPQPVWATSKLACVRSITAPERVTTRGSNQSAQSQASLPAVSTNNHSVCMCSMSTSTETLPRVIRSLRHRVVVPSKPAGEVSSSGPKAAQSLVARWSLHQRARTPSSSGKARASVAIASAAARVGMKAKASTAWNRSSMASSASNARAVKSGTSAAGCSRHAMAAYAAGHARGELGANTRWHNSRAAASSPAQARPKASIMVRSVGSRRLASSVKASCLLANGTSRSSVAHSRRTRGDSSLARLAAMEAMLPSRAAMVRAATMRKRASLEVSALRSVASACTLLRASNHKARACCHGSPCSKACTSTLAEPSRFCSMSSCALARTDTHGDSRPFKRSSACDQSKVAR